MNLEEAGHADFERLARDLRLGYGTDVDVRIVDTHHSKSNKLPIVATEHDDWNTSVAWYGYNYYNHYSAFRFKQGVPATLLYPISGTFGRKHHSGHEQNCPLLDVTNHVKDYWNRRSYEGFACFAGAWHMATTLRYLEAVSKIDTDALFACVMDDTKYGPLDTIDGNAIDFVKMCRIVGTPEVGTYERDVLVPYNRVVKAIRIDWYGVDTDIHPTCVTVEAMSGMLLPGSSSCGDIFVEPLDTRLAPHLDDTVQLRWSEATKYSEPRMLRFVPTHIFNYWSREQADYVARRQRLEATPWRACGAYNVVSMDATQFRFVVPNQLDAALFVKWWLEAGIPCAETMIDHKETNDGTDR